MTQAELLNYVLAGDQEAILLINDLSEISQTWDDLIDRDKPVSDKQINTAFIKSFSNIPRNIFYAKHQVELLPLVEAAILDWTTSNIFQEDPDYQPAASVLRDNLALVIVGSAKIIGGMEWAEKVSVDIRKYIHDESISHYQESIRVINENANSGNTKISS